MIENLNKKYVENNVPPFWLFMPSLKQSTDPESVQPLIAMMRYLLIEKTQISSIKDELDAIMYLTGGQYSKETVQE